MQNRVVITGLGVVAANGIGLKDYSSALRAGKSGIRFYQKLRDLGFACQVGGIPELSDEWKQSLFDRYGISPDARLAMNSSMNFGTLAGLEAWTDAGLAVPPPSTGSESDLVHWETGAIVGTGIGGMDTTGETLVPRTNEGKVRRLGSTMVEQTMASSVSAKLAGFLALGNHVTTNSSACTTGTEAAIMAYRHLQAGYAERMLAGGSEGSSHYIWAGFDAMRVLSKEFNEDPTRASRPLSASAGGFVPSSGAGVLVLETLDSARKRGARIYAEILGGALNCGGHRQGGSMTAPNPESVVRCVRAAMKEAQLQPRDIDLINGHLTATMADPKEILNWTRALELSPEEMPWIQSTKSMIGHGLGAAGGVELVASVLQLHEGFIHPSLNCEDLHPALQAYGPRIPRTLIENGPRTVAKSSFGFGDVNGCILLKKWDE